MNKPDQSQLRQLIEVAKQASDLAYCPYSKYSVGAAVLTFDGQIYSGCNIENCGFTQTIHAEQTAMAKAISAGALQRALNAGLTQLEFISAVAVHPVKGTDPWPCCNCRQSLNEYGLEMWIVGDDRKDGSIVSKQLSELIPHAFTMELVLASVYGENWKQSTVNKAGCNSTPNHTGMSSHRVEAGDDKWSKLSEYAKEASKMAYCPYSHYPVGAAVLSFDGQIYTGCNVENCSYTQTIHAEQVALSNAISEGALKRALAAGLTQFDFIEAVAVFSPKGSEPWPSCFGRQFLNEFGLQMDVIGANKDGTIVRKKLEELIPYAFPMDEVMASVLDGES